MKGFTALITTVLLAHIVVPYISSMGVWEPLFWILTSLTALGATLYFIGREGGE